MKIKINGKFEDFSEDSTISSLLERKGLYEKKNIAVTLNSDIVSRESYTEKILRENDEVNIYTFVQGG